MPAASLSHNWLRELHSFPGTFDNLLVWIKAWWTYSKMHTFWCSVWWVVTIENTNETIMQNKMQKISTLQRVLLSPSESILHPAPHFLISFPIGCFDKFLDSYKWNQRRYTLVLCFFHLMFLGFINVVTCIWRACLSLLSGTPSRKDTAVCLSPCWQTFGLGPDVSYYKSASTIIMHVFL